MQWLIGFVALLALGIGSCAPQPPPGESSDPQSAPTPAAPEETSVLGSTPSATAGTDETELLAVGDIASCDVTVDETVAALAAARQGVIAIPGDAVYNRGTAAEYRDCFDPAWGPMYDRIRPAAGNHDYYTKGATGFFSYFDERIRRPGRGWFAFNVGPHWRGIVLNSNCGGVGGCAADSPQGRWFAGALADARDRHVFVVMHHPRFSTGEHGSSRAMRAFFRMMYRARAPLLLTGHEHMYERFAPQDHRGRWRANGVRQFIVGTGGRHLYPYGRSPLPRTQVRDNKSHGLLRLLLRADGYSWQFISVNTAFSDSGEKQLPLR